MGTLVDEVMGWCYGVLRELLLWYRESDCALVW